jgi:mannose-6-phosphate isomerase class I
VLFYEIMQNSDVIIGLSQPATTLPECEREVLTQAMMEGIHIEEGFDCKTQPVTLSDGANARTFVFACTYFALERLDLTAPYTLDCNGERFFVLSQIKGASTVVWDGQREVLRPGQTCLLPASLGAVTLEPESGPCALLKAYVPDLLQNIIRPLRTGGVADGAILGLGGRSVLNPLGELLR